MFILNRDNLKFAFLSFNYIDGFNNSIAIKSNDVQNLAQIFNSHVHHWLHHE